MQKANCKLQIEQPIALDWRSRQDFHWLPLTIRNFQFSICNLQFAILPLTLILLISICSPAAAFPEAPLVGRKEPYCGAISQRRFQVSISATPTKLQSGDPILFTIHIQAVGPWLHAPERPDLKQKGEYAKFRDRFFVENAQERLSPDQGSWEFDYSIRPKNELVK